MSKITIVTGGCRSGKSFFAMNKALDFKGKRYFFATATAFDDEMKLRIATHKQERADRFSTIEVPYDLVDTLMQYHNRKDCILLVDCLTVWLGNLMYHHQDDLSQVTLQINRFSELIAILEAECILVTNEVGMGIVPENKMAREFRDFAGTLNRKVAKAADEVFLSVCGIPLQIK